MVKMERVEILEVASAVREFHYYRATWNPLQDEELVCEREEDNQWKFPIRLHF